VLISEALKAAGCEGKVKIAMDCAASEFYSKCCRRGLVWLDWWVLRCTVGTLRGLADGASPTADSLACPSGC